MQTHFPRIILGATSTGLGAFFKAPQESLLVERSSTIGSDFAGCFYPGKTENYKSYAHDFFNEAAEIGVLQQKGAHLPGVHSLFYKRLVPFASNCLLLTEVIEVKKNTDFIQLTVFNKHGFMTYTCDELIDATVLKITNQAPSKIQSVSLGAIFIALNEEKLPLPLLQSGQIIPSCFSNEFYFHLPLSLGDASVGRSQLLQLIRDSQEVLTGWGLAATSLELKYTVAQDYSGIAHVICPSNYSGFVEAFYTANQN